MGDTFRNIKKIIKNQPTRDGAGVSLKRVFGFYEANQFDPFLLLDDFGSDNPKDYLAGFPWHPHRGIETVTYMLQGEVEHGDSLGNTGVIHSGDVQWMTAGSGIIHQEMPKEFPGRMRGFQLWVNLPAAHKMMAPRYRDVKQEQIPEVIPQPNVKVKILAGELNGIRGPVQDLVVETEYLDFTLEPGTEYIKSVSHTANVLAYVIEGNGIFTSGASQLVGENHLVRFDSGEKIAIHTETEPVRFLLISGEPLNEPVAWRGPIVMNTQEELDLALREFRNGTFIKKG